MKLKQRARVVRDKRRPARHRLVQDDRQRVAVRGRIDLQSVGALLGAAIAQRARCRRQFQQVGGLHLGQPQIDQHQPGRRAVRYLHQVGGRQLAVNQPQRPGPIQQIGDWR